MEVYTKEYKPKSKLAKLAVKYFIDKYGENYNEIFYSRKEKCWLARYGSRTFYGSWGAMGADNWKYAFTDEILAQNSK